jgi:hypothetical protein
MGGITTAIIGSFASNIITNGLVLNLDASNSTSYPGTGTTWYDLSPSGLNATGSSAIVGNQLQSNQPYTTASTSILNTDTHTIGYTFKLTATGTGTWDKIFGWTPAGTDRAPGIWRFPSNTYTHWRYDPGNTGINIGSGGTTGDTTPSSEWSLNTWYYLCVTKNGGTLTAYVNGIASGSASVVATKTTGNSTVQIFPSYTVSTMFMKHIHIYNRVLPANEILSNYNAIKTKLL